MIPELLQGKRKREEEEEGEASDVIYGGTEEPIVEQEEPLSLVRKITRPSTSEDGGLENSPFPSNSPPSSSVGRASVIKYTPADYSEQNLTEAYLRCESEMLRHQSSILMQAGNILSTSQLANNDCFLSLGVMMNKQANIIQKYIETGQPIEPAVPTPTPPLPGHERDIFPLTDHLLQVTPFYNSLSQHSGQQLTDLQVDELLRQTIEEMEEKQGDFKHLNLANIKQETKTDLYEEGSSGPGCISVIMGPDMSLTMEEQRILDHLKIEQTSASKSCCPVRCVCLL